MEKNYDIWEKAFKTTFKTKNKLGFIDGLIIKSKVKAGKNSNQINTWEIVNAMIMSYVMNMIDPKLHMSIAYVDSAQKMWDSIQNNMSFLTL